MDETIPPNRAYLKHAGFYFEVLAILLVALLSVIAAVLIACVAFVHQLVVHTWQSLVVMPAGAMRDAAERYSGPAGGEDEQEVQS